MNTKFYLFLLGLILMLSACGKKVPEGVVFSKEFKPAEKGTRTETRVQTHVRRKSVSNISYTTTHRVSYPDRWIISVHSKDKKDTTVFYVHKAVYDTTAIGAWFVFDTIMGTTGEPYTILDNKPDIKIPNMPKPDSGKFK